MIKDINSCIDYIGTGNALALLLFVIGTLIAFYFYFKTFYRLVYSTERICSNCENFNDWKDEDSIFRTRIIFFNNGRKTITQQELKNLQIVCSRDILKIKIIKSTKGLATDIISSNNFCIEMEYLDSSKYIVLEIKHKGNISVEGRISESGEILNTENKTWRIINFILIGLFYLTTAYYLFKSITKNISHIEYNFYMIAFNMLIWVGIFFIIRYIHKLFFIPDKLTLKYLHTEDKWNKGFQNDSF